MSYGASLAIIFIFGAVAFGAWLKGLINLIRFRDAVKKYSKAQGLKAYWYLPSPNTWEAIENDEDTKSLWKATLRCGGLFFCSGLCIPIMLAISSGLFGG